MNFIEAVKLLKDDTVEQITHDSSRWKNRVIIKDINGIKYPFIKGLDIIYVNNDYRIYDDAISIEDMLSDKWMVVK